MTSYDEIPYESRAHYANHPDRMAVVATMLGLEPPEVSTCRVLELGCAEGGNLLPMAASLPGARIVGIDLSPRQVELGRAAAAALGLANIELHAMSVTDVDASFGTFDYILAHGLYSWVPPEVQEAVLRVFATNLAPGGVAMVSYNCYPGWRFRGMVREVLQHQTRHLSTPAEKVAYARQLVPFLAENARDVTGGFKLQLESEQTLLAQTRDTYVFHELFEEWNLPLYFHELVERVGRHGLSYLGETRLRGMTLGETRPEVDELLSRFATTFLEKEQLLDFLRNRQFRQSLLVKGDAPRRIHAERIERLLVRSKAIAVATGPDPANDETWEFRTQDGARTIKTNNPLVKCALVALGRVAPRALAFGDVLAAVCGMVPSARPDDDDVRATLCDSILKTHLSDLLELHVVSPPVTDRPGAKPVGSPVARWEIGRGDTVTTLWHERLDLADLDQLVLQRLDGTRDRDALIAGIVDKVLAEGLLSGPDGAPVTDRATVTEVMSEGVDTSLANLTRSGVLVA